MFLVSTSTYGKVQWCPKHDPHNKRMLGIYPVLVETRKGLTELVVSIHRAHYFAGTTRTSVRVVMDASLLCYLPSTVCIEATVPFDRFFPARKLVYLAMVDKDRCVPELITEQIDEIPRLLEHRERILRLGPYEIVTPEEITHPLQSAIISFFQNQFSTYHAPIGETLFTNSVVVLAHAKDGTLAAVFMGKRTLVEIDGKTITFIEFEDVAALKRAVHLIPSMALQVIKAVMPENPFIFAHARADVRVLQRACIAVGMKHAGTMESSFILVEKDIQNGVPYKNAHVWYIP